MFILVKEIVFSLTDMSMIIYESYPIKWHEYHIYIFDTCSRISGFMLPVITYEFTDFVYSWNNIVDNFYLITRPYFQCRQNGATQP